MAEGAVARARRGPGRRGHRHRRPGGGTPEKPVGLVWFAAADRNGTAARSSVVLGTRREIRARAAQAALNLLRIRLPALPDR